MIKAKHVKKIYNSLVDSSVIQLSKEYSHLITKSGSSLSLIRLFFDTLYCKIRYRISTKEYFYFSFYEKSSFARKAFIGELESTYKLAYIINKGHKKLFVVKSATYNAYKPFYKRDLITVSTPSDIQNLMDFANVHNSFIIKPVTSSQGRGVKIVDLNNEDKDNFIDSILKNLNSDEKRIKYVIEELIIQDPFMASFHPESVNTIRYAVFYGKENVEKLFAIIRIGVGDNRVDNTHAGGICAAIDLDSGLIISEGVRQNGERHYFHPDTGVQILGTKIPRWDELNQMVEELVPYNSPVRLVGWDFALSQKGWCIVEGNPSPSLMGIQGSTGIGYKKLFMDIVKKCQM
jgi:Glutathione synthase/Ribosomal protein S6 modification enzyme (glutaminyl transferase)